ncbi:MAG TPA: hypothetical protein VHE78_16135 [Gemmatimonadaceae bacterium]|nr:hypothetical protein [Gemmatimonadaceae bacterium]
MKTPTIAIALLAGICAGTACGGKADARSAVIDRAELTRREERLKHALSNPDADSAHDGALARWLLPDQLKEIAGLTLTPDGRLLTHGVKRGRVFEIDYRRGMIVKEFSLGKGGKALKGAFEGITVVNDVIFIMSTDGRLYEFREGKDGSNVNFLTHDTGLKGKCDFQGVAFDRTINSLLLVCNKVHDRTLKDSLVIFRWKLEGDSATRASRLTVPLTKVIGGNNWKTVHPSDITVDPFKGNYVLIAAAEKALIEITPSGDVVNARLIPGNHPHAEGVAITKDSLLIISDEAGHRTPDEAVHRPAVVTLYRWQ